MLEDLEAWGPKLTPQHHMCQSDVSVCFSPHCPISKSINQKKEWRKEGREGQREIKSYENH